LRTQLHTNAQHLKQSLRHAGVPQVENPSHIVPVLVNDAARCKQLSDTLLHKHQIYVQPINYPTVAKGAERLRFTPSPHHQSQHVEALVDALQKELQLPHAA